MPGVTTTKYCLLAFFSFTTSAVSAEDPQQRVSNLMDNPVVQEAMSDIIASDAQLLDETIELTEIPAITLSRGGVGANAHAPNESWTNENAHLVIHIALITLLVEAGAIF